MIAKIIQELKTKMQKSMDKHNNDLSKVRTGRAHPGILDHVQVDYYGSMLPISQVANVTVTDARTITVQAWESTMVKVIEKAIRDSDLGLNPAVNGGLIRVPMPPLTEERRRDLIKVIKSEAEDTKVAIRNIRRDANNELKALEKDKKITEDEEKRTQDEVQKVTDKYIAEIDKATQNKETELLTV